MAFNHLLQRAVAPGRGSKKVTWRRSALVGSENAGILSLPEEEDATEDVVEGAVCPVGSENAGILSLVDGESSWKWSWELAVGDENPEITF